jgi:hypothetical protein
MRLSGPKLSFSERHARHANDGRGVRRQSKQRAQHADFEGEVRRGQESNL